MTPRRSLRLVVLVVVGLVPGCGAVQENTRPVCSYGSPTVLMAQSVPDATLIPCVRALPVGWHFRGFEAMNGESRFWLDSEVVGARALEVALTPSCDTSAAKRKESDEPRARRFERVDRRRPAFAGEWIYRFEGGCSIYSFSFTEADQANALGQIERGVSFIPRRDLADAFHSQAGSELDPPTRP